MWKSLDLSEHLTKETKVSFHQVCACCVVFLQVPQSHRSGFNNGVSTLLLLCRHFICTDCLIRICTIALTDTVSYLQPLYFLTLDCLSAISFQQLFPPFKQEPMLRTDGVGGEKKEADVVILRIIIIQKRWKKCHKPT